MSAIATCREQLSSIFYASRIIILSDSLFTSIACLFTFGIVDGNIGFCLVTSSMQPHVYWLNWETSVPKQSFVIPQTCQPRDGNFLLPPILIQNQRSLKRFRILAWKLDLQWFAFCKGNQNIPLVKFQPLITHSNCLWLLLNNTTVDFAQFQWSRTMYLSCTNNGRIRGSSTSWTRRMARASASWQIRVFIQRVMVFIIALYKRMFKIPGRRKTIWYIYACPLTLGRPTRRSKWRSPVTRKSE